MDIPLVLLAAAVLAATGCTTVPPTPTPTPKPSAAPVAFSQGDRIAMRLGGGETVFLTGGPAHLMPSVSPDGRMVAFVVAGPGDRKGTYVVNLDGTGERQVAPSASVLSRPAWSPDSRRLALRDTSKEQMGIWTVDIDGQNRQRIFTLEAATPVWSPDGKSIAFASGNSTKDGTVKIGLYVTDPEGKAPNLVAEGWYGELAWSPDGKLLAAVASPKGAPRALLVMGLAGGEPITLTADLAEGAWAPAWSPDGKSIALVTDSEDGQHLVVVSAAGSTPKVLAHGKSFSTPVWSADGSHLVVARDADGSGSYKLVRVSTSGALSVQELGSGETPCAIAGSPTKPSNVVAAQSQVEGMRRADLVLVTGSWG